MDLQLNSSPRCGSTSTNCGAQTECIKDVPRPNDRSTFDFLTSPFVDTVHDTLTKQLPLSVLSNNSYYLSSDQGRIPTLQQQQQQQTDFQLLHSSQSRQHQNQNQNQTQRQVLHTIPPLNPVEAPSSSPVYAPGKLQSYHDATGHENAHMARSPQSQCTPTIAQNNQMIQDPQPASEVPLESETRQQVECWDADDKEAMQLYESLHTPNGPTLDTAQRRHLRRRLLRSKRKYQRRSDFKRKGSNVIQKSCHNVAVGHRFKDRFGNHISDSKIDHLMISNSIRDKKAARVIRNREVALRARQMAKLKMKNLENENNTLKNRATTLENENLTLRAYLQRLTSMRPNCEPVNDDEDNNKYEFLNLFQTSSSSSPSTTLHDDRITSSSPEWPQPCHAFSFGQ